MADCQTKTCFICKQSLAVESFHRSRDRPDGRYPYCKPCNSKRRIDIIASDPERAAKDVARKAAYDAVYRAKHVEKSRARSIAAYKADPEGRKAYIRAWQKLNVEKVRAYKTTNKARRRSVVEVGMCGKEYLKWKRAQAKVCHWCGVKCARSYRVDHYVAQTQGGQHCASNLVIACPTCNRRKSAKDPLVFAREVGRLF